MELKTKIVLNALYKKIKEPTIEYTFKEIWNLGNDGVENNSFA